MKNASGLGGIYHKGDGLLYGQYTSKEGKRKSVYQKKKETEKEFRLRFNKIIEENENNNNTDFESKETLNDILERHIEMKHNDGITSGVTYLRNMETLSQLNKTCRDIMNKPISQITVEDIENCKPYMRLYSASCIEKQWILLKKGFKIAFQRRKIPFNPMEDEEMTKPISLKKTEKKEALSRDEYRKLLNILDTDLLEHKYRNIIKLQAITGMRIGEVLGIKITDIDRKNKTIHIQRTLTKNEDGTVIIGDTTKTYSKTLQRDNGERYFPITPEIDELISRELSNGLMNVEGMLFYDYGNNRLISPAEINSQLRRINEKYNITDKPFSSHILRHTYATTLNDSGVDFTVIQYLLGHIDGSSITRDTYISVNKEHIEDEIKKIDK